MPGGELLITAPIMFGKLHILPIVLEFLRAYPDVNVRLVLADTVIDLLDNHVDVAATLGRLPDSGLVATRVGEVRWITCASPGYLAQRGTPEVPADLADHDGLAFERLQTLRNWSFGSGSSPGPIAIRLRLAVNTADALIEAAEAGLGVVRMMSYQAATALREGKLVRLLHAYEPEAIPVHLVHTGPSLVPLKLRVFLDFAGPGLKRHWQPCSPDSLQKSHPTISVA